MNTKRKDKEPLFAEVKLTGDEFKQSPSNDFNCSDTLLMAGLRVVDCVKIAQDSARCKGTKNF